MLPETIADLGTINNMEGIIDYLSSVKRESVDLNNVNDKISDILLQNREDDINCFSDHFVYISPRILSKVMKKLNSNIVSKISRAVSHRLASFSNKTNLDTVVKKFRELTIDPDSFSATDIVDIIREDFDKSKLKEYIDNGKVTYHVSSLSSEDLKINGELVKNFTIRPSGSGANKCGVYTSPYPNLMYTGGDIANKKLTDCVIFAYQPDMRHLVYGASQDYLLDNIECSSGDNNGITLENIRINELSKTDLQAINAKHLHHADSTKYYLVTSESYQSAPYIETIRS